MTGIGGASSLGRYHRGAQRRVLRTLSTKVLALRRFDAAGQDFPTSAARWFCDWQRDMGIAQPCIELVPTFTQLESPVWNHAQPAPRLIANLVRDFDDVLCRQIAFLVDASLVAIFDLRHPGFELLYAMQDAGQQINWFETGNNDGHAIASYKVFVRRVAADRANMSGCQEGFPLDKRRNP